MPFVRRIELNGITVTLAKSVCGAKARSHEGVCKRPAGWGTDHLGEGRCRLHAGCSTGPKNTDKSRMNALKGGEYEAIWFDHLTEPEKVEYHKIRTDSLPQIDEEIKLITIREKRMMGRIEKLLAAGDMTIVEETSTSKEVSTKATGTLGQVQAIEEALTRVQARKRELLELRHKITEARPPESDTASELIRTLKEGFEKVAVVTTESEGPDSNGP